MGEETWRDKIVRAMGRHGDGPRHVVAAVPEWGGAWLDEPFCDGFGGTEGCPFTVWTAARVYFPTEYDGSESVASVSRDPDGKATEHV